MDNGSLDHFMNTSAHIDPINMVGILIFMFSQYLNSRGLQISGIAGGLQYLHSIDIVHGNLKAVCNIVLRYSLLD